MAGQNLAQLAMAGAAAGQQPLRRLRRWLVWSGTERSRCRALLRLCREADAKPELLAMLLGRPPRLFNPDTSEELRVPTSAWPFVDDTLRMACGGCTEYAQPAGSIARAARSHWARARALGMGLDGDLQELGRRIETARALAQHLDAVAGSHREACGEGEASDGPLGEGALERVPPGSAEPLAPGELLITHPVSGLFQPAFDRAVVVVTEVVASRRAVHGLVCNASSEWTLAQALVGRPTQLMGGGRTAGRSWNELAFGILEPYLSAHMLDGGPLIRESLDEDVSWLHRHGDVLAGSAAAPRAQQLAPSLWFGGDLAAIGGAAKAAEDAGGDCGLRFLRGSATWNATQLSLELERGVWVRARAAKGSDAVSALCFAGGERTRIWRNCLWAAGQPVLATFPRGTATDAFLGNVVEAHQRVRAEELLAGRWPES